METVPNAHIQEKAARFFATESLRRVQIGKRKGQILSALLHFIVKQLPHIQQFGGEWGCSNTLSLRFYVQQLITKRKSDFNITLYNNSMFVKISNNIFSL